MNSRALAVTTLGFISLFSGAVHADPREDLLQAIGRCSSIADDKARLGCYDAAAPHLHDVLNVPPAAMSSAPTKEEEKSWFGFNLDGLFGGSGVGQTTPQQFGAETTPQGQQKIEEGEAEVESIAAGVTQYSFSIDRKFIVFLDNGQIWREADSGTAHFHREPDNTVTIKRGILGSYILTLNNGDSFKVTRMK